MINDNHKPGAGAPGDRTSFVTTSPAQCEADAASASVGTDPHRAAGRRKRQAEAVVDPDLENTPPVSRTQTLIAVLPPEAVVRLVLFAGRLAKKQGKRLPPNIEERLGEALARGDAAAPVLRDWAIRIGVLAACPNRAPASNHDTKPDMLRGNRATEHDRATLRAVIFARKLRERLGMSRRSLLAKAERKASLGLRLAALNDTGDESLTVSDDPERQT